MLARGMARSSLILLASRGRGSRRQRAAMVEEIAARAGCQNDRQITGGAVERVIAAILGIVPGDLGRADPGRIAIHGRSAIVDADLPRRAAGGIGTGDNQRLSRRLPVTGSSCNTC